MKSEKLRLRSYCYCIIKWKLASVSQVRICPHLPQTKSFYLYESRCVCVYILAIYLRVCIRYNCTDCWFINSQNGNVAVLSVSICKLALWYQVRDTMPSFPKIKPEAQEIKSAAHFFFSWFYSASFRLTEQTGAKIQRCLDCVVDQTPIFSS